MATDSDAHSNRYILSFQCPDRIGVVARSTGLLLDVFAFIT